MNVDMTIARTPALSAVERERYVNAVSDAIANTWPETKSVTISLGDETRCHVEGTKRDGAIALDVLALADTVYQNPRRYGWGATPLEQP